MSDMQIVSSSSGAMTVHLHRKAFTGTACGDGFIPSGHQTILCPIWDYTQYSYVSFKVKKRRKEERVDDLATFSLIIRSKIRANS